MASRRIGRIALDWSRFLRWNVSIENHAAVDMRYVFFRSVFLLWENCTEWVWGERVCRPAVKRHRSNIEKYVIFVFTGKNSRKLDTAKNFELRTTESEKKHSGGGTPVWSPLSGQNDAFEHKLTLVSLFHPEAFTVRREKISHQCLCSEPYNSSSSRGW